jgi:hypothetical protein
MKIVQYLTTFALLVLSALLISAGWIVNNFPLFVKDAISYVQSHKFSLPQQREHHICIY